MELIKKWMKSSLFFIISFFAVGLFIVLFSASCGSDRESSTVTVSETETAVLTDEPTMQETDQASEQETDEPTTQESEKIVVISKPSAVTTLLEYSGSGQCLDIPENPSYTISQSTETEIGNYQTTVFLAEGMTWDDGTSDPLIIDWSIVKKKVDIPDFSSMWVTYDGHEHNFFNFSSPLFLCSSGNFTDAGEHEGKIALADPTHYCWLDGTTEEKTCFWKINKQPVTLPESEKYTYTGKNIQIKSKSLYEVTYDEAVNVGKYTAAYTLVDQANYCWSDGSSDQKTIEFEIVPQIVSIPKLDNDSLVFNGKNQSVSVPENEAYTIYGDEASAVGNYYASVKLTNSVNYVWENEYTSDIILPWSITKKSIDKPTLIQSVFEYDGKGHKAAVVLSDFYGLSAETYKVIGQYEAVVTLSDTYNTMWADGTTSDFTLSWSIIRNERIELPVIEFTYDGNQHSPDEKNTYEYQISSAAQTDAGTYEATVSLNYPSEVCWADGTTSDKTITWKINKASFDQSMLCFETSTFVYDGTEKKLNDLSDYPAGVTVIVANDKNTNVGKYTATVTLSGDAKNYDLTQTVFTFDYEITKATFDISSISFADTTVSYDGKEKELLISGTLPQEITPVYTQNKGTQIGDYSASVSFSVSDNYNPIDAVLNATLSIEKGKFDLNNISFEDTTLKFNGREQVIPYSGYVPEGIRVVLSGGYKGFELGTYEAVLTVEVTDHSLFFDSPGELHATLTIVQGEYDLTNVSFESQQFTYDKTEKTIVISGNLPEGVSVTYYNNTAVGEYDKEVSVQAYAIFSAVDSYHYAVPETKTAVLTIVPSQVKVTFETSDEPVSLDVYRYSKILDIARQYAKEGYSVSAKYNGVTVTDNFEITDDITAELLVQPLIYTVSLTCKGGTLEQDAETSFTAVYDSTVVTLPTPKTLDATYSFAGWYDYEHESFVECKNRTWNIAFEEDTELTLTAIWTASGSSSEKVTISATEDYMRIAVSDISSHNKTGYIYAMNPGVYYSSDTTRGLSSSVYTGKYLERYLNNFNQLIFIDRIIDGIDMYSEKYYFVNSSVINKGPVYAVSIDSEYDVKEAVAEWNVKTKKGLFTSDTYFMDQLDLNGSAINLDTNGLIMPNEIVNSDGSVEQLDWSSRTDLTPFEYNGKTYYFDTSVLYSTDVFTCACYWRQIKATIILLQTLTTDQYKVPYYLQYAGVNGQTATYMGYNTSNEKGADYYGAMMSFLAKRYSQGEYKGYCVYFVLGNEIDFPTSWNAINEMSRLGIPSLEVYTEEYYRSLRMLVQAVRKYNNYSQVLVSYTHFWYTHGKGESMSYRPYDINELLIRKTNAQGNFDWGIASHAYPYTMVDNDFIYSDLVHADQVTYDVKTPCLSFSNMEVYDLYLDREGYYLPDGGLRPVVLTEAGISTGYLFDPTASDATENEIRQAASIAYAYYKAEMLQSIEGFVLYKDKDHVVDGSSFGIMCTSNGSLYLKKAYYMWMDIDKSSTSTYTDYLTHLTYITKKNSVRRYFESGTTYLDVIKTTSEFIGSASVIDWDSRWEEMKIRLNLSN